MTNPTWPNDPTNPGSGQPWQPPSAPGPTAPSYPQTGRSYPQDGTAYPQTGPSYPQDGAAYPPTDPGYGQYPSAASGTSQLYTPGEPGGWQQGAPGGAWPQQPPPRKKSSWWKWAVPLAALLAAALVVTLLVVGGDPGVKDGDRDITNAKAFADDQRKAWEDTLPKRGIAKSDDAGCYYLADEESEEVTKKLACGPVRRPMTKDTEVWDIYAYTVQPGSKEGEATAGEPDEQPQKAQPLPGGTILVNGDGKQVEIDGKDLKEPEIPKADPNMVWDAAAYTVADGDAGDQAPTSGQANVAGLGSQYNVDSLVEYKAATVDDSITHPADGQKLYVLTLSSGTAPNPWSGTNTLTLKAGDQEHSIPEPAKAAASFLVSAPDGGPFELVVDSAGKKQTLNLLTGERTGDPGTEALYTDGSGKSSSPGTKITLPRASQSNGVYYDITVTVDSVSTIPYQDGWAPDGQVFLTMQISSSGTTNSVTDVYYNLDCAATTINEGTVTCTPGNLGTATISGSAAAGPAVTLNFAGQLLTASTPYAAGSGYPVPFTTTTASVPLPQ